MSIEQQIIVRGEAEQPAPADIAALTVVVQVDDSDQAKAFRRASEVAAGVDAVLDARAGALGPRQAAVVVVQPTTRWDKGEERRTGWRAARSTSLDVVGLDQLTPLVAELVAAGAVVQGPSWRLRPDHPVRNQVRAAAAADARGRADAYAAALGLGVGRVEWVAEPGLRGDTGGPIGGPQGMNLAMRAAAGGAAEEGMAVEPAELIVSATVEVAFTIERG